MSNELMSERVRASVPPAFMCELEEEAARTHLRLPSLVRQLLAEALETRRLNRVELPKKAYLIKLSDAEKERLERLAYTVIEDNESAAQHR